MTIIRRLTGVAVVALAAALFVSAQGSAMAGWEKADSVEDNSKWDHEGRASDGDPALYAIDKTNSTGLGTPLVMKFGAPETGIVAKKLRVKADWWGPFNKRIVIKIQYRNTDGEWVWATVHNAAFESTENAVYKYIPVPEGKRRIRRVQFQWEYKVSGYWFWLYELQLFEVDGAVEPGAETLEPSSVNAESAVLRGRVEKDGNDICQVLFQYGTGASFTDPGENDPDWTGDFGTGEARSRFVNGLTPGVTYYCRAVVRNSAGLHRGEVRSFVACAGESDDGSVWVSPTGWDTDSHTYNNHTRKWQDGGNAYDDWNASSARCYHEIHDPELRSPWLYFYTGAGLYDGVRFRAARPDAYTSSIEIQVPDSLEEWKTIYIGGFQHDTFQVKGFPLADLSQARVRFYVSQPGVGAYWNLFEFDFRKVGVNLAVAGTPYYREEQPGVHLFLKQDVVPVQFRFGPGINGLDTGRVVVRVNGSVKLYTTPECAPADEIADGRQFDLSTVAGRDALSSTLTGRTLYVRGFARSGAERDSRVSCSLADAQVELAYDEVKFTVVDSVLTVCDQFDDTRKASSPGSYDFVVVAGEEGGKSRIAVSAELVPGAPEEMKSRLRLSLENSAGTVLASGPAGEGLLEWLDDGDWYQAACAYDADGNGDISDEEKKANRGLLVWAVEIGIVPLKQPSVYVGEGQTYSVLVNPIPPDPMPASVDWESRALVCSGGIPEPCDEVYDSCTATGAASWETSFEVDREFGYRVQLTLKWPDGLSVVRSYRQFVYTLENRGAYARRVSNPEETSYQYIKPMEHFDIGSTFSFFAGQYFQSRGFGTYDNTPASAQIKCQVWSRDGPDILLYSGNGSKFEYKLGDNPGDIGDTMVRFYRDKNNSGQHNWNEVKIDSQRFWVMNCKTLNVDVHVSDRLADFAGKTDAERKTLVQEAFDRASALYLKKDSQWDWRACVKLAAKSVTVFAAGPDRPDPVPVAYEDGVLVEAPFKLHHEEADLTFVDRIEGPLRGVTFRRDWRTIVAEWCGADGDTKMIPHEFGHGLGLGDNSSTWWALRTKNIMNDLSSYGTFVDLNWDQAAQMDGGPQPGSQGGPLGLPYEAHDDSDVNDGVEIPWDN